MDITIENISDPDSQLRSVSVGKWENRHGMQISLTAFGESEIMSLSNAIKFGLAADQCSCTFHKSNFTNLEWSEIKKACAI